MNAAIVMTTVSGGSDLPARLVEERLAACVQELPTRSTYRWDVAVQRDDETVLLIKTVADRIDDIVAFLQEHHPYAGPRSSSSTRPLPAAPISTGS